MSRGGTSPIPWKRRVERENVVSGVGLFRPCVGTYILNAKGRPVFCKNILVWGRFMQNVKRHVRDTRKGGIRVSTVFLGLDHGFGGRRLLWETCVFGGEMDGEMERYETRAQAVAGHSVMCARVDRVGRTLH